MQTIERTALTVVHEQTAEKFSLIVEKVVPNFSKGHTYRERFFRDHYG